jgi:hypothetical protein
MWKIQIKLKHYWKTAWPHSCINRSKWRRTWICRPNKWSIYPPHYFPVFHRPCKCPLLVQLQPLQWSRLISNRSKRKSSSNYLVTYIKLTIPTFTIKIYMPIPIYGFILILLLSRPSINLNNDKLNSHDIILSFTSNI